MDSLENSLAPLYIGNQKFEACIHECCSLLRLYILQDDKENRKGRAIVEVDTDGSYVMSEKSVDESNKVKMFDKFIDDLKELLKSHKEM